MLTEVWPLNEYNERVIGLKFYYISCVVDVHMYAKMYGSWALFSSNVKTAKFQNV